ncbi:hypothetical protein ESCO_002331 [Escovopsis weberi]|uniref:Uncharacterized protein n=1 Tax=Escovopsis weberi TaxID=150374 RepID=A0A0M9VWV7_ESCWE|nr:hypothetical protein ESCO_002331 [Escovopsis weberi]
MAAPPEKTIHSLDGRWNLNKTLSNDPDPVLALQGIGYLLRKAISYAPISLDFRQYEGPPNEGNDGAGADASFTHIDIVQTVFKVSSTLEPRCLDYVWRARTDKVFGEVEARSRWVTLDELVAAGLDEHLAQGWLTGEAEEEGKEEEGRADGGEKRRRGQLVLTEARSTKNGKWDEKGGWTAWQVWGFREIGGERRHARNVVAKRGGEARRIVLYYDYVGPVA